MMASQKFGVARPMMATERPQVVGGGILAHRRVDAHRQRDHEPDEDGQQAKLNGDWQSGEYLLLYRPVAPQGLAQGAV